MAIAGLILGILSLISAGMVPILPDLSAFFVIFALLGSIVGLILSSIACRKRLRKGVAIAGIVFSALALLACIIMGVLLGLLIYVLINIGQNCHLDLST